MSLSPEVYTARWPLNAWPAVPSTVRGSSVARPPTAAGWQRTSGILPALTEDISRWRVDPSPAARCDSPTFWRARPLDGRILPRHGVLIVLGDGARHIAGQWRGAHSYCIDLRPDDRDERQEPQPGDQHQGRGRNGAVLGVAVQEELEVEREQQLQQAKQNGGGQRTTPGIAKRDLSVGHDDVEGEEKQPEDA